MTVGAEETADAAIRRVSSFPAFATGSASFDALLAGGYRAGTLTLLFGRSNSGKTQLAMQAAMLCAKGGSLALFVDTEGSFRPERVEEIAGMRGLDAAEILRRIVYLRSDSVSEQMDIVRNMAAREETAQCGLVVVDTLTRNFSVELPGRANVSSRQAALNVHLSEMARDAYLNGRAYLLTNRVTFGSDHDVGIGGKTVEQLVGRTVLLERDGSRVRGTLMGSGERAAAEMGKAGID